MKRIDLVFAAWLVPLDYGALLLAAWASYSLRFHSFTKILPVVSPVPINHFFALAVVVAVGWLAILAMAGVYRIRPHRLSSEMGRIFFGASTAVLLVIVFIFFQREFFASRFIILASWVFAVLFVWVVHLIVRGIQQAMLRRGIGARPAVIFGGDRTTEELVTMLRARPGIGLAVVRVFPDVTPDTLSQFDELLAEHRVDIVIQGDANIPKAKTYEIIERCAVRGVAFNYVPDTFDTQVGYIEASELAGMPVMVIHRTPLDGWGRILKRLVDMVVAGFGTVICFIPGLVIAAIIKLDSAGPVFVRLERVGQGQRRFTLWKFRSMVKDAHALKSQLLDQNERADGPLFKITHDPRVTRVGRWLRKTSIDEIPQFWNVLRGEMSMVGPRPHEPEEVARYDAQHKKLLTVRPGLTGMAQISGRSNLSFEDEARLDMYYIEHWSLGLDLTIMVRTPAVVLTTKAAV